MKPLRYARYLFLGLSLTLVSAKCTKNLDDCAGGQTGVIKDYTGLDGCKWLIELSSGERLEPVNLDDFLPNPFDGQAVRIRYEMAEGYASICMAGTIVKLICLEPYEP